jgi:hypothetical protein
MQEPITLWITANVDPQEIDAVLECVVTEAGLQNRAKSEAKCTYRAATTTRLPKPCTHATRTG